MRSCMVLRYAMLIQLFLTLASFSHRALSQTNCISVSSSVCAGDCVPVTYIGMGSQTASYQWSISCGTITNPNDQNPHTACFNTPGLCTIQVIWQERGNAPETCHVEVEVFPLPQGRLTLVSDSICKNNCTQLRVDLTGRAPYSFAIKANQAINNYVTNSSPYVIDVCPDTTTLYSLLSVSDFFCTNTAPGSQTTLTVLPEFVGTVKQIHNELCAEPANLAYSWYACGDTNLLSNQVCFSPPFDGCYCVVIDDGVCKDTVCESFKCDLICSFYAPDTICVGDTALIYYTGNGGPNTQFLWVVDVDQFVGLRFAGVDTLRIPYTLPGCYSVNLGIKEASCFNNCSDTICVVDKPCTCDTFTKNQVVPLTTPGQDCCYEITGDIASLSCFTAMEVYVSAGVFTNVQPNATQGWMVRTVGGQTMRFEHGSGSFPPGNFNAGSFCVTGADRYVVTVQYLRRIGSILDSCKYQYVFDCRKGTISKPCDSLSSYLEKQHTLPNFCCYNIHMNQPNSNVFVGIHVQLSSGNFSLVQSDFLQGYIASVTGPRDFVVTHSSGFLPSGPAIPASFCVTGAFNPVIVKLQYYYMTPQGLDSCSYRFIFDCPGGVNPNDCCDSTQVRIVPTSVTPDCCYELELSSSKAQCYSKICLETLSGSFSTITPNAGWSVDSSGPGICFVPNSGFIPTGTVKPGRFCVQGTGSSFQVNVDLFDPNGMLLDSCKKRFTLECNQPPALCRCDSLKNFIVPVSINPGNCCYDLFSRVPVGGCFTGIQLFLSSGSFSSIQAGAGYTAVPSGGQMININPVSGFLQAGLIHPASFCVIGASTYQLTVLYFSQSAGIKDTCRYVLTFDCPSPPNFCRCDSLKNQILPAPAIPGACCYELQGIVPAANCFTQIQLHLSSGSFTNIQTATGWSAITNGLQNFTLVHGSGYLPQVQINPVSFCVTGSSLYTITVVYYYNNAGALDTCSFSYLFDCPSPPKPCRCDSLINVVSQTSVAAGLCCYNIKGNVPYASCFTHVQVSLSNGQFANVQPQTGWAASIQNLQQFTLNPLSGPIASGPIYPADFCVVGANSYSITVQYYFFNGGQRDSCSFKYSFNCPYVVDSTCYIGNCASGTRTWQTLATGVTFIYDMVVYQCKLIVAGQFNMIGGTPANNIAAWDGNSWTALGSGVNGIVRALSVHNGILYAGGQFTTAGSVTNANHIAAWNGSSWTGLDGGVSAPGGAYVTALLSTANGLVAGGIFQQAGIATPLATRNIALWNGVSWSQNFNSSPNVFDGPIYSLREYMGQLYAAGTFTTPFLNTARWNGSNWSANGGGINLFNQINYNGVEAQYVYNGDLIVGGRFRNADNLPATQHIASWNGSAWQAMAGSNMPDTTDAIHDFIQYNNKLYAGGAINQMGAQVLNGVGEWDGTAWSSTGHPKQLIHALASFDSCGAISCDLYSGGEGSFNRWVCVTSTEDASEKMEFTIRPNPARDRLQLVFGKVKPGTEAAIRLFNVDGKVHHVEVVNNGESMELDVSGLPPGLYVLEYRDGRHQPVVRRFSKM